METCGRVSEENNEQRRTGRGSYAPSRVSAYFRQMNLSYLIHKVCINSHRQIARMCRGISITQRLRSLRFRPGKRERVSYFSISQTVPSRSLDSLHNAKPLSANCTLGKLSVSSIDVSAMETKGWHFIVKFKI